MWALIMIQLSYGIGTYNTDVQWVGTYEKMEECFYEREAFIYDMTGSYNGYPPVNTQLVCVRVDFDE